MSRTMAVDQISAAAWKRADAWPLVLGFAALAVPTAISLYDREWTHDYGAHQPLVLLIGGWLFWRERRGLEGSEPGRPLLSAAALAFALPVYILGRAFDFPTFEALGLYAAGLALLHARFGLQAIRQIWFPLVFLLLAIPPPLPLLDAVTAPLKESVSALATSALRLLGLPIARQGVVIFVAQYELLVEDACSGLNSLMGLTALSLLYGYLSRGSSLTNAIFMLCISIPVAVAANVVRVSLLVVITYLWGDAAAQGFLHFTAGILLFLAALAVIFIIDQGARALLPSLRPRVAYASP